MCFVCVQANADSEEYAGHIRSDLIQPVGAGAASGYVDTLVDGITWTGTYGQAATITYSFSFNSAASDLIWADDAQAFNAAEQQAAIGAMAKLSAIANLNFVATANPDSAQLVFYKGTLYQGGGLASYEIDMDNNRFLSAALGIHTGYNANFATVGTNDYVTLLHELGHIAGLVHPFEGTPALPRNLDNNDNTVMSYTNSATPPTNFQWLDIEALQLLYGAASGWVDEKILSDNNDAYTIAGAAENVKGGWGIDTLVGGAGNDTIYGGKSQADPDDQGDIIRGEGGNDIIYGNGGNDNIEGNAGNDTIWGGRGFDTIYGGTGDDSLAGGGGIEHPDDESDTIYGGAGNDSIIGNGGDDLVYGEAGNDTFWGGYGNDTFYGGDGNDLIMGQFGNDSLIGGAGNDTFYFYNANHNDTIADFTFGDIIRLDRNINNSGIQNAQDAANFATYSAGVAILDFGGGHVINVVTAAPLTAASFEII